MKNLFTLHVFLISSILYNAQVHLDRVLADLVELMHPEISLDHELVFMDKFDKKYNFPLPEGAF